MRHGPYVNGYAVAGRQPDKPEAERGVTRSQCWPAVGEEPLDREAILGVAPLPRKPMYGKGDGDEPPPMAELAVVAEAKEVEEPKWDEEDSVEAAAAREEDETLALLWLRLSRRRPKRRTKGRPCAPNPNRPA